MPDSFMSMGSFPRDESSLLICMKLIGNEGDRLKLYLYEGSSAVCVLLSLIRVYLLNLES